MMWKFKLFVNFRKEEEWLNVWLQKGYELIKVNRMGIYTFKTTEQRNQVIKIDFQVLKTKGHLENYEALYEEFGWRHIAGNKGYSHHYLIKEKDGQNILFSDNPSEAALYKRLATYYGTAAIIPFVFLFNHNAVTFFLNPKAAYLTQGLWQMENSDFWSAFLFETPFAFMRISLVWIFPIITLIFLYNFFKYQTIAKNIKNKL
ncbi:DUF2812 domain-containing protein [Paenibacillus sp. 19GGS1-52]|uniref:DUF2812 domain-containing protein n=1 Tax=Paenibacillus sp. 19GGS1-52 TaxID=2758563 RepID=UPI001EFBDD0C|nr:DUF2812 domain-containing protein [Paenibacillus sp. 19GGS1-52]ULO06650.1 DUF2812 domain-containing protein [Paenibacillus sp. 19GGS1-52]